ncbi:MAG: sodium:proton antiporter [Verrucomicrobiales bacterium]|nr:sodium:proton antiporter [Verrucomicrobiales bacterium]
METWLLFFPGVLLLGIVAQWIAWRFRFPSILALLVFGFIAGQFMDQSRFVNSDALFAVVSLSVAVIMLEGGLSLHLKELKEAGRPVLRLISLGAAITWVLASILLHYLGGFGWRVALVAGAILVVTGPTVIGPLLRNVRPKRPLNAILKWEGIVIDPVGAVLAVLVFGVLFGQDGHALSLMDALKQLGMTLLVGLGLGSAAAYGLVIALKKHLVPDFLQSVLTLSIAVALFAISNLIQHESGLVTVTVLGMGLANQRKVSITHIVEFKENLRVILISSLFIVLAGRVQLADIVSVWKEALLVIAGLVILVRPLSVWLSLMGTSLKREDKAFIAMLAPRGIVAAAVSAIFALELGESGGPFAAEAQRIVPMVFSIIFATVTLYGLLAAPLAQRLGVASPNPQGIIFAGSSHWVIQVGLALQEKGYRILIIDRNYHAVSTARMAGLPAMHANVISDFVTEEVDLSGIGRMLAVTANDEVNALACIAFSHTLGRSHVYQLEPVDAALQARKTFSDKLSGRRLFAPGITTPLLHQMEIDGCEAKVTRLTKEFTFAQFTAHYGTDAIPMFVIRPSGTLKVRTQEDAPPSEGDLLVSLTRRGTPTADESTSA